MLLISNRLQHVHTIYTECYVYSCALTAYQLLDNTGLSGQQEVQLLDALALSGHVLAADATIELLSIINGLPFYTEQSDFVMKNKHHGQLQFNTNKLPLSEMV